MKSYFADWRYKDLEESQRASKQRDYLQWLNIRRSKIFGVAMIDSPDNDFLGKIKCRLEYVWLSTF